MVLQSTGEKLRTPTWPKPAAAEHQRRYLWLLLAFAAAIRLFDLGGKQLWVDEIMQAMVTSPRLPLAEVLRGVTGHVGMTPLDYILQHDFARVFGQSEFALRLPAALFGAATIAAVYGLFRRLLDARLALLTAALYAVYPLHHHYSQEGRPYSLFVLLTVLSWLAFGNVLQRGSARDWILYGVTNTLLLYSQYFGVFVLASQFALSLPLLSDRVRQTAPFFRKTDARFLAAQAMVMGISALLLLPWVLYASGGLHGYAPMPAQFGFRLALSFVQELGDGSHPLAWILILFAALGARKLAREKSYGVLSLLLLWLLLPVPVIFLVLWLRDYFFAIRHFLFITPALYALVALGIADLSETMAAKYSSRRVELAAAALVAGVSLLVIALHVPDTREDFKGAAAYLRENLAPGDIVVAPRIEGILSYYYPEILQHTQPAAVLADHRLAESLGRKIIIVDTAYMPATDRQHLQSILGNPLPGRITRLQKIEVIEVTETGAQP